MEDDLRVELMLDKIERLWEYTWTCSECGEPGSLRIRWGGLTATACEVCGTVNPIMAALPLHPGDGVSLNPGHDLSPWILAFLQT